MQQILHSDSFASYHAALRPSWSHALRNGHGRGPRMRTGLQLFALLHWCVAAKPRAVPNPILASKTTTIVTFRPLKRRLAPQSLRLAVRTDVQRSAIDTSPCHALKCLPAKLWERAQGRGQDLRGRRGTLLREKRARRQHLPFPQPATSPQVVQMWRELVMFSAAVVVYVLFQGAFQVTESSRSELHFELGDTENL